MKTPISYLFEIRVNQSENENEALFFKTNRCYINSILGYHTDIKLFFFIVRIHKGMYHAYNEDIQDNYNHFGMV